MQSAMITDFSHIKDVKQTCEVYNIHIANITEAYGLPPTDSTQCQILALRVFQIFYFLTFKVIC